MSWLFSQVLVEEYSGDISSDGEQSVQLSGNPTQQAYLSPDKMTEYSRLSRFGMMFKPLTEDRGEELLMSYLAAFHARTSLPQEKVPGLTESDQECGEKWRGSFTKYDPDSSSWKTHQCSLLGDLDEFSGTWPRWGLMRDGECWEQQMSAHRTNETESGLKEKWPTPRSCSAMAATITPESAWAENRFPNLETVVGRRMWPTPCATDYKGSGKTGELRDRLDYAVERGATKSKVYKFPTPNASDHIQRKTSASWAAQGRVNYVLSNPEITGVSGGKLNPMWVEWLMGWPLGWTDLKPLEMDKFQKWQEQHGRN
jgi:hypothetical protein